MPITMEQVKPTRWSPLVFLIYQLLVIAVLLALMIGATRAKATAPTFSWDHVVPLWVPWAGALGGAAISLVGVAGHSHEWNGPRYAYWHLARPVLGMITGTVAVLALLFVLKGIAPDVIPTSDESYTAGGVAVMFVIAFVVGYREETFRELVKRVVDVLLGPGEKSAQQRLALIPEILVLTAPAGGGQATGVITVFNDTQDTFDLAASPPSITGGAAFSAVWSDVAPLAPSGARGITVTWTAPAPAVASSQIVNVELGGYRLSSTVRATT